MSKKKSRKRLKQAGLIALIVIVALIIVSLVYVSNYYHVQNRQARKLSMATFLMDRAMIQP